MPRILNSSSTAWSAINLVLHSGLKEFKPRNSRVLSINTTLHNKDKTGSIAVFRSKDAMSNACGFVITSKEALRENGNQLTHWTPNIYSYLGYDEKRKHIKGHIETNLNQINTFVVDIDFKNAVERDHNLENLKSSIVLGDRILPTLILKTDKGYQVYYILDKPAFLAKHKNGTIPVLTAARKIAENIKRNIQDKLIATDVGCNNFGIFRIPREDNIMFFEPDLTSSFATLLTWSQEYSKQVNADRKLKLKVVSSQGSQGVYRKQCDQAWFKIMLGKRKIMPGQGLGRHNTILTLALACYSSGKTEDETFDLLDEFNSSLEAPLELRDMQRCVRDAFSGNYKGAAKIYIDELIDTWATYAEKRIVKQESQVKWYKYAKSRSERIYSHKNEWLQDIIDLINRIGIDKDSVEISTRRIREELNISAASLNRVLKQAVKSNKLVIKKGRGNKPSKLATLSMALKALFDKNQQLKDQWISYLKQHLGLETTKFIEELSVFNPLVEGYDEDIGRWRFIE